MQGDVELLIKIIIPAILLIFWALSNLFNRENAQNATKDRAASLAPRPASYPPRPAERRVPPPPPRYVPAGVKDDVLIIRAEPNRPSGRPGAGPPPRRGPQRQRGSAGAPPRRPEPPQSGNRDLVGGALVGDMNQSLTRPMELRPLTLTESMASAPSVTGDPARAAQAALPPATIFDLRAALMDPSRVREAFILNEILRAPVSRRRK